MEGMSNSRTNSDVSTMKDCTPTGSNHCNSCYCGANRNIVPTNNNNRTANDNILFKSFMEKIKDNSDAQEALLLFRKSIQESSQIITAAAATSADRQINNEFLISQCGYVLPEDRDQHQDHYKLYYRNFIPSKSTTTTASTLLLPPSLMHEEEEEEDWLTRFAKQCWSENSAIEEVVDGENSSNVVDFANICFQSLWDEYLKPLGWIFDEISHTFQSPTTIYNEDAPVIVSPKKRRRNMKSPLRGYRRNNITPHSSFSSPPPYFSDTDVETETAALISRQSTTTTATITTSISSSSSSSTSRPLCFQSQDEVMNFFLNDSTASKLLFQRQNFKQQTKTTTRINNKEGFVQNEDENAFCQVCFVLPSDDDAFIQCRHCNLFVHAECYLSYDPDHRPPGVDIHGYFTCQLCAFQKKQEQQKCHADNIYCQLCLRSTTSGGFVQSFLKKKNFWVHLSCFMNCRTLYFSDNRVHGSVPKELRENIQHVQDICKKRNLQGPAICDICSNPNGGFLLPCAENCCSKFLHPLCAGLSDCEQQEEDQHPPFFRLFKCVQHSNLEEYTCSVCGKLDDNDRNNVVLECGLCKKGFHTLSCVEPPLLNLPKGDWSCPSCCLTDTKMKSTNNTLAETAATTTTDEAVLCYNEPFHMRDVFEITQMRNYYTTVIYSNQSDQHTPSLELIITRTFRILEAISTLSQFVYSQDKNIIMHPSEKLLRCELRNGDNNLDDSPLQSRQGEFIDIVTLLLVIFEVSCNHFSCCNIPFRLNATKVIEHAIQYMHSELSFYQEKGYTRIIMTFDSTFPLVDQIIACAGMALSSVLLDENFTFSMNLQHTSEEKSPSLLTNQVVLDDTSPYLFEGSSQERMSKPAKSILNNPPAPDIIEAQKSEKKKILNSFDTEKHASSHRYELVPEQTPAHLLNGLENATNAQLLFAGDTTADSSADLLNGLENATNAQLFFAGDTTADSSAEGLLVGIRKDKKKSSLSKKRKRLPKVTEDKAGQSTLKKKKVLNCTPRSTSSVSMNSYIPPASSVQLFADHFQIEDAETQRKLLNEGRPKRSIKIAPRFMPSFHNSLKSSLNVSEGFPCPRCSEMCQYDSKICASCGLLCQYSAGIGVVVCKNRNDASLPALANSKVSLNASEEAKNKTLQQLRKPPIKNPKPCSKPGIGVVVCKSKNDASLPAVTKSQVSLNRSEKAKNKPSQHPTKPPIKNPKQGNMTKIECEVCLKFIRDIGRHRRKSHDLASNEVGCPFCICKFDSWKLRNSHIAETHLGEHIIFSSLNVSSVLKDDSECKENTDEIIGEIDESILDVTQCPLCVVPSKFASVRDLHQHLDVNHAFHRRQDPIEGAVTTRDLIESNKYISNKKKESSDKANGFVNSFAIDIDETVDTLDDIENKLRSFKSKAKDKTSLNFDEEGLGSKEYMGDMKIFARHLRQRARGVEQERHESSNFAARQRLHQMHEAYVNRTAKRAEAEIMLEKFCATPIVMRASLAKKKQKMNGIVCCQVKDCRLCSGDFAKVVLTNEEMEAAGGDFRKAIPFINKNSLQIPRPEVLPVSLLHVVEESITDDICNSQAETELLNEWVRLNEMKFQEQFIQRYNNGLLEPIS